MPTAKIRLMLCLCVAVIATACGTTAERPPEPAGDRQVVDSGRQEHATEVREPAGTQDPAVAAPVAEAVATPSPAAPQPASEDQAGEDRTSEAPASEARATGLKPDEKVEAQPEPDHAAQTPVATAVPKRDPQPSAAAPAPHPKPTSRPPPVATTPAPEEEAAPAARITGRVDLVAGPGHSVAAGEVGQAVVYFLPDGGAPRPKPQSASISTRGGAFSPPVTVVTVGSTVRFPNEDTILHNVFSRSPGNSFDLGLYGAGEVRQHRFATPGLVVVNCNVHHNMRANLIVLATPYHARPGRDGRYRIEGIPPGSGTLVFWHPRSGAQSVKLAATGNVAHVRRLTATRPPLGNADRAGR